MDFIREPSAPLPPSSDAILRTTTEEAIVNGLVRMVRQRDPLTASHLDAVGLLTARLGNALGLDPPNVERIALAARLHDIGKHAVSLSLLNKPSALSDDEWREVRLHPHYGATIVVGFPHLERYEAIVRSHHERIDGRGYPDGLVGDQIPYEARMIAVTDAFHAMTVSRAYTQVRTPNAALEELRACSGTQFDEEYVEVFCKMMRYRERSMRSA
jgi:HD-GYP domain-containing protein (c-di-GMP phosphodiesterase class II)